MGDLIAGIDRRLYKRLRRSERRAYNRLYWDITHFDMRGVPNGRKRDSIWGKGTERPKHSYRKRIGEEDIVRALWINDPEGKHLRVPCA